jgi:uncharacterized protein YqeY
MRQRGSDDQPDDDVRARLRRALGAALRARDQVAASALRSTLGALGNAEAIPPPQKPASSVGSTYIAGAAAGLGAGEAPRRRLSEPEATAILRAEIAERLAAAADYERSGRSDRAGRLRREAQVLTSAAAPPRATADPLRPADNHKTEIEAGVTARSRDAEDAT